MNADAAPTKAPIRAYCVREYPYLLSNPPKAVVGKIGTARVAFSEVESYRLLQIIWTRHFRDETKTAIIQAMNDALHHAELVADGHYE